MAKAWFEDPKAFFEDGQSIEDLLSMDKAKERIEPVPDFLSL